MDVLLCNDDGYILHTGAPSATDEVLAFHYGNFDGHYGDATVAAAAANGRVYADTVPSTLPARFGSIGTPTTASGQTTYVWTPPSTSLQANVLLVAGGGATREFCGGGGAGGVIYKTNQTLNSPPYTIKVGDGGIGQQLTAGNGYNTEGFGSTAIGGGGGESSNTSSTGKSGGSGGGNGPRGGTGGSGTAGQGNAGGGGRPGESGNNGGSGGGGGASQAGTNGGYRAGGNGGNGFFASVFGETYGENGWFGGGGAGFGDARNGTSTPGIPGLGGGGTPATGVTGNNSNTAGDPHTGGGAGAGGPGGTVGRDGGSGIVAIRYIVDSSVLLGETVGALDALDSSVYTSAVGAYALRQLFKNYAGPHVRLRRSTDNEETDVYFSKDGYPVNINITTWLGGGTGYAVTWYDQGPTGKHTTGYGTSATTLPSIYERPDGLYAIYFPGTSSTVGGYFNAGSVTFNVATNGGVSSFSRVNLLGANTAERVYDYGNSQANNNLLLYRSSTGTTLGFHFYQGSTAKSLNITNGVVNNTWQSFGNRVQGSGSSWVFTTRKDGTETSGAAQTITYTDRTITNSYIGRSHWSADSYSNMYLSCQIFFNTGSITSQQFATMESTIL